MIRAVVDSNVILRAVIKPNGSVGPVLQRLRNAEFVAVYNDPLLTELADVLNRPRIREKYALRDEDIRTVIALLLLRGESVEPSRRIDACRDPKDNMILEAAVEGRSDFIVSGDGDLLVLRAFEGIPIVESGRFLRELDAA